MLKKTLQYLIILCVLCLMGLTPVLADVTVNGHTYQWANWNGGGVNNGPPSEDTVFSIDEPVSVTYLDCYHYNNGMGVSSPGYLYLIGDDGTEYGPFYMESIENNNVIWHLVLDEGEVLLPAGSYTVYNSDPDTWSNNAASGYAGFFGINWEKYVPITEPPTYGPISTENDVSIWVNRHNYQWVNWNIAVVQNGPPAKKTVFTVNKPVSVTYIDSYHWNDGRGVTYPISLTLVRDDGTKFGPFELLGSEGQGGVKDAIWYRGFDEGELILPAGTYEVIDSDPKTWSNNGGSDNAGFFGISWKLITGSEPNPKGNPSGNTCPESSIEIEYNIDHHGSDYKDVSASDVCECAKICESESKCVAFAYVSAKKECWLKDKVPPVENEPGTHSGVKK